MTNLDKDGYWPFVAKCRKCRRVVFSCRVGNGAGDRYARIMAEDAVKAHQCPRATLKAQSAP